MHKTHIFHNLEGLSITGPENICTGEHITKEVQHLMAEWSAAKQSVVDENLVKERLLGLRSHS